MDGAEKITKPVRPDPAQKPGLKDDSLRETPWIDSQRLTELIIVCPILHSPFGSNCHCLFPDCP